jgi:hypothetical protein
MKLFVPVIIEKSNDSMTHLRLKGRKMKYFLHRDIEVVNPRFSS